jgi:hypothetical protein
MDKYRFATIAGAAVLLSLAALPARAQAPGGSYLETCTHVRPYGDGIIADCRRVDGSWGRTALRDVDRCVGGIANMNGNLTCNRGGERRWDGYGSSRDYRPDYDRDHYGR